MRNTILYVSNFAIFASGIAALCVIDRIICAKMELADHRKSALPKRKQT